MTDPARRTQSRATLNLRRRIPGTSMYGIERTRSRCLETARSSCSTVPSSSQLARRIPFSIAARISKPSALSRNNPDGAMNLSAFHSTGLWLAEVINPPAAGWCAQASVRGGGGRVLEGKVGGGGGGQTEVDGSAPDRLEGGNHCAMKHRTRHTAIASDDDRARFSSCRGPGAEARGIRRDNLRGE